MPQFRNPWTNRTYDVAAGRMPGYLGGLNRDIGGGMSGYQMHMARGYGLPSAGRRSMGKALSSVARASRPLSNTFGFMGRNVTYGRAGMTAGLGMLAARNGANMMDRMRYGDYGGAMMSGAMTAAAGYGAYATWMHKGALRSHFNNAAAWLLKRFR